MRDKAVVMSSTMPSAKYSCSASPLMFWKGSTAIEGLSGRLGAGRAGALPSVGAVRAQAIDAHRARDVLDDLLADILERAADLAAHLLVHLGRDAGAAGLRQRFQPRGDVDALAIDVRAFADHVAEIDADAEQDAATGGLGLVRLRHPALKLQSRSDGIGGAAELDQYAVAHDFHDAPAMGAHRRAENGRPPLLQRGERAGFILLHEAAVADHVGHEHGGQAAFHGPDLPRSRA